MRACRRGGPIPARAGQPRTAPGCGRWPRAYPRSRGATSVADTTNARRGGLSPLARGNPLECGECLWCVGPIPARAGQPNDGRMGMAGDGAYPRSRGATTLPPCWYSRPTGLSPLARGNPRMAADRMMAVGPIPARAGQPSADERKALSAGAYPRSRGATRVMSSARRMALGLSPLARGNLSRLDPNAVEIGPIPARAGQPEPAQQGDAMRRAYPRSRGATGRLVDVRHNVKGLSPLARGNRVCRAQPDVSGGPIPARAGQPKPTTKNCSP